MTAHSSKGEGDKIFIEREKKIECKSYESVIFNIPMFEALLHESCVFSYMRKWAF